jgi:hypothetical protein
MASNYFANQNLNDIAIQSEDGGGMIFTKQGKFLFGAKLPEINEQLNEEFYQGNVDVNPNTNSSFIGIMNANSEPIDVDIPSTNQYSLFTPLENVILEPNPPKDDCANEFNDAATVLLTWENDNVALGWDPYGANGTGIQNGEIDKAKKYFLDNYWNTNNKNTGNFSVAAEAGVNQQNSKLLIKNLPPGLRIMAAQFNYNAKQWWTRILATVGEDWLNSGFGVPYRLTANLNSNSNDSYEYLLKDGITKSGKFVYNPYKVQPDPSKEFTLKGDKRIQLFIDQYDQIIDLYNKDKAKFLSALKDETIRYYTKDETIRYYTAFNGSNTPLLNFHKTYVEKAYELALKYMNCPVDDQMTSTTVKPDPNKSTESTKPKPSPPVSLTAQEIEEGIYEANFLPASEDEGAKLIDEILVQNPDDITQNAPTTQSSSVINPDTIKLEINKIKKSNNNIIPKEGLDFKKYKSLFKLIEPTDVKDNLGNQVYYPTALFNQGDPTWGSLKDGIYTMRKQGCAYVSFCMLVTYHKKDAGYTPEWMWNNASQEIVVKWSILANTVNLKFIRDKKGTMDSIDELLKTKPVEFEWVKETATKNGYKGEPYAKSRQHWMVIVGKNSDRTYTIFDPNGGKIRENVIASSIKAGLGAIVYIN